MSTLTAKTPAGAMTDRTRWSWAILAHAPLWSMTWALVEWSPALGPNFADYVSLHFWVAVLFARLAGVLGCLWELAFGEPPRYMAEGWMSAFEWTLVPLFVAAFAIWRAA
jgi:hypothetical protein